MFILDENSEGMDVDADGLEVRPRAGEEADDAAVVEDGDGEGRAGAVAERPDGALVGDELERGDDVGVVPDGPHRAVHLLHVLRWLERDLRHVNRVKVAIFENGSTDTLFAKKRILGSILILF